MTEEQLKTEGWELVAIEDEKDHKYLTGARMRIYHRKSDGHGLRIIERMSKKKHG